MPIIARRLAAPAAALCLAAGLAALPAPPAGATTVEHVAGNFFGDGRVEILEYRPGTGADYIFANVSKASGAVTMTVYSVGPVNATYTPVAGDFDGDGYDEIFWYQGGDAQDWIWDLVDATTIRSTPMTMGSLTIPIPGDFTGDGADDILFYGPNTVADQLWDFNPGTPGTFSPTVSAITANGDFVPTSGGFTGDGADDIVWYRRGTAPDYMWDFNPGSLAFISSQLSPINLTTYQPFALDTRNDGFTDIFWYNPGSGTDAYWDFTAAGIVPNTTFQVIGTYDTAAGDLFGDGHDDIFWFGSSSSIWDWNMTPTGLVRTIWTFGATALSAVARAAAAGGGGTTVTLAATPQGSVLVETRR
jgi:hypothetical protein